MVIPYTGTEIQQAYSSNFHRKLSKVVCIYKTQLFFQYTQHTNIAEGLMRAFLNNCSGCRKNQKNVLVLPLKYQFCVLETEYLGNHNRYCKKFPSDPREGDRDYFVAQIRMKSRLRRSKQYEKNGIPQSSSSPAAHNTFSAVYVRSTACPCGQYPVALNGAVINCNANTRLLCLKLHTNMLFNTLNVHLTNMFCVAGM